MMIKFTTPILVAFIVLKASLYAVSVSGSFVYSGYSGSLGNYEYLGVIDEAGTSTVSDQIIWGRASNGRESASFTIGEGLVLTGISASVPSNQSANNPQSGTFIFGSYDSSGSTTSLWQIGDDTPLVGPGDYSLQWFVPAKGQGGSSSGYGTASFSITVDSNIFGELDPDFGDGGYSNPDKGPIIFNFGKNKSFRSSSTSGG